MAEKDLIDELRKSLQPFPHTLQMDVIEKVKSSKCEATLERLQSEKQSPCDYEDDLYKRDNLISLLYFRLGRTQEAFASNDSVRKEYPANITALVHLAYMKMIAGYEHNATVAIRELNKLRERKDYDNLIAIAHAEQGFSFARTGPKQYKAAVKSYEMAINFNPDNYVWKFGYALVCRRFLNPTHCYEKLTGDELKLYCEEAFENFSDIAHNCHMPSLRARAWVELGEVCLLFQGSLYPLSKDIVDSLKLKIQISPKRCFDMAMEICEARNDEFVLERFGKYLRFNRDREMYTYSSQLQEGFSYLMMAYKIRKTSFSCEHLSRVLIEMAQRNIYPLASEEGPNTGTSVQTHQVESGSSQHKTQATTGDTSKNLASATDVTGGRGLGFMLQSTKAPSPYRNQEETQRVPPAAIPKQIQERRENACKFKLLRKSPRRVMNLQRQDTRVRKAMSYLNQAIKLSKGCNKSAIYRLGLLYRQIGDLFSAMAQFRRITSDKDSSAFEKTNAYEQRGYILLDLSEDRWRQVDRKRDLEESQKMMMLSLEQAAILVAHTATMGSEDLKDWQALPTLRQLLSNDTQNTETIKFWADLCTSIGNHKESLVFYNKLRKINPEDPEILSGLIKNFVRLKEFHNAQTCLRLLLCTSEGRVIREKTPNLIYQVYLGAARHILMTGQLFRDNEMIRLSFRGAFEQRHGRICDEDDQSWDVFILDDPHQTDAEATAIQSWLKETCGLSVTRNCEEGLGGALSFSSEVKIMTSSRCLVAVFGEKDTKRQDHLLALALSNEDQKDAMPSVTVPILTSNRDLPMTLKDNQAVRLTHGQLSPAIQLNCFMSLLGLDIEQFEWLV